MYCIEKSMFEHFKFQKFLLIFFCFASPFLSFQGFADYADDILAAVKNQYNEEADEGYIINFTDVSITEYIRFVSKVLGINFIFDEAELQFKTTIVSEEPIKGKNVLSALIQVLRIHNLHLIEQNRNLLITTNKAVSEIPQVVADNIPGSAETNAPIVTRIFLIKNTNAESIAEVIRPMLSASALLKVMKSTNQLIVSDIVTNVEQIVELLVSLDSAHSPLEVDTYECKNISPENLIAIAQEILEPFREGKTLTLVPQNETQYIFIVSTNALIERTLSILEDLDSSSQAKVGEKLLIKDKVFVYKIVNQSPEFLLKSILQITEEMEQANHENPDLFETLTSVRWIKGSNSLMFLGDSASIEKVQEIMEKIDSKKPLVTVPDYPKERVFIYKIQEKSPEFLIKSIQQITSALETSEHSSQDLLQALSNVRWIKDSNSLMFIGDELTIEKIKDILTTIDTSVPSLGTPGFFLFPLKTANKDQVEYWLHQLADNLAETASPDEGLINAIRSVKWMQETNSLLFSGNEYSLKRLKTLLETHDFSKQLALKSPNFLAYHPKHRSGEVIEAHIREITENLKDSGLTNIALLNALNSMRWSSSANTLTFTGDEDSLLKIETMVEAYDLTGKDQSPPDDGLSSSFFIYKPKAKTPEEIKQSLIEILNDLKASQLVDPMLMRTLSNMQFVESTQSFLFSGTQDSLEKVSSILERIDVPKVEKMTIQKIGKETFLIYKVEFVTPSQLIASLRAIAGDLAESENVDKDLIKAIDTVKWVQETHSLLFIGNTSILEQIEKLAQRFDIPSLSKKKPDDVFEDREAPSSYILYVPKYQSGPELILMLSEFKAHLMEIGIADKTLFDTIDHLKWVEKSHAILVSGTQKSIAKVEELLDRFDEPIKAEGVPTTIQTLETTSFLVYKLQYHHGSAIQEALNKIAKELSSKENTANQSILDAINSLQWINITNSLVATGHHHALEKLKELIRNLDIPLKQVFFEVLIIETTLANTQDFGLQWGSKFQYLNKFAAGTGNFPPPPVSGAPVSSTIGPGRTTDFKLGDMTAKTYNSTGQPTALPVTPKAADVPFSPSGFDLGIIGDILLHRGKSFISLGSLVSALQTDSDTTVVLNPKIITQDNNNSTLFVGQNIPFVGSSINNTGGTNSLTTTNLEYRDIGLNLSITPTLSTSEVVTIDIQTDFSQQIGTESFGDQGVTGIKTSHTSMNTRVTVPNRHFLILSGMLNDDKEHSRAQIPCLGGLPLIGAAFSQNLRKDIKSNILIFLKPYIINSFAEYKTITENQEVLLKEESSLPIMAEEIDAGLEWVKTPEDDD